MNKILILCIILAVYFVANGIVLVFTMHKCKKESVDFTESDCLIFTFLGLPIFIMAYAMAGIQWIVTEIKKWLYRRKHHQR